MRPLPVEIQRTFPEPRLAVRDRPWWRRSDDGWVRNDGTSASHPNFERYDREDAVPHPGIRAGQVWAWVTTDGIVEQRVIWKVTVDPKDPALEAAFEALPPDAFLMADPACPHLAPWGPA